MKSTLLKILLALLMLTNAAFAADPMVQAPLRARSPHSSKWRGLTPVGSFRESANFPTEVKEVLAMFAGNCDPVPPPDARQAAILNALGTPDPTQGACA